MRMLKLPLLGYATSDEKLFLTSAFDSISVLQGFEEIE